MTIFDIVMKARKVYMTFLYRLFIPNLKINPYKSHFHGTIHNSNGEICISDGLRNKLRLNINVNDGELNIGENNFYNNDVSINVRGRVKIGNSVIIGENVKVYDHDHNFRLGPLNWRKNFSVSPVTIEDNVWIGSNVVILKGVTIGSGSVIAAGSIVSKNVTKNSLLLQARVNKEICLSE